MTLIFLAGIGIIVLLGVLMIWKTIAGLHSIIESLRRDLEDTKDKITDRMGKNAEHVQQRLEKTLDFVGKQLGGMDTRIDKRVGEINQRLDAAAKMMGLVQKQYGTVENLSQDIRRLQEAFKSPKPRGGFGERALVDLVGQVLPVHSYNPQHTFPNGSIVDVLITTANGSIPVDAKFPLENYLRLVGAPENEELRRDFRNDVKKHIRDVAKKYILPQEGTLEFALMYVPSDAVMYEILIDEEVSNLAESSHVFILSPHSFYYFLNIIRLAYQSQQFAENAKQVLALIRGVQQQSTKLGEELGTLQKHIGNAHNKMTDVQSNYGQLELQIAQTNLLEIHPQREQTIERAKTRALEREEVA